jgi:hypothetical protein
MPDTNGEEAPRGWYAPGGSPRTAETVMAELDHVRQMIYQLGRRFRIDDGGAPIPLGRPVISVQELDRSQRWEAQKKHARSVLMRLLSPENQERLTLGKELIIKGSQGTVFHVDPGDFSGNISIKNDDDEILEEWCVHPQLYDRKNDWYLPSEYAVAVQVVALQTDESKARATANVEYYD